MNDQENKPALFTPQSELVPADAGGVARAIQEIQAALVIAQRFPRDEVRAEARIIAACKRKGLAEMAEYEYSRGGTRITGPTIDLLRAIANRWGNLLFGWSEVERRMGESTVRCWAWDTQNNSRAERSFVVRHWRDTQGGGYELKDERDIYELLANMASRRVRACLEEVIDSDMVDKAVEQCRKTLKEGVIEPLRDRAAKMLIAFTEMGVTQNMIERRIGNKLDAISENQLASLKRVYKAIRDGVAPREEYFRPDPASPDFGQSAGNEGPFPPPEPERKPPTEAAGKPQDDLGGAKTRARAKTPQAEAAANAVGASSASPEPTATPGLLPQEPAKEEEQPFNHLKALRGLIKSDKLREGAVLDWLAKVGSTDGDVDTLESLQLNYAGLVVQMVEQWSDIRDRIVKGGS